MTKAAKQHAESAWCARNAVLACCLLAVACWVGAEAYADILRLSLHDEESSHVFLVPVAVAWLVFVRRLRMTQCVACHRWVGTMFVAAGWLLWSYGYRHDVQSFWHFGAILMSVGAVLTAFGSDVLIKFLPAFAVLIFLVPVPSTARQQIAIPLQRATAQVTQNLGELIGMDVARHGNLLTVNGKDVAIAEACNGMRMVFTLFLSCYLFAFTTPLRTFVRLIILAASPFVAIAANVLRMIPTVWMFGHTSEGTAAAFHDASGWIMLVASFLGLLGITRALRWASIPITPYPLATN